MRNIILATIEWLKVIAQETDNSWDDTILDVITANPGLLDLIIRLVERWSSDASAFAVTAEEHIQVQSLGIDLAGLMKIVELIVGLIKLARG